MNTSLEMLIHLFERAALLLICLFFMIRIPRFKESLQKLEAFDYQKTA